MVKDETLLVDLGRGFSFVQTSNRHCLTRVTRPEFMGMTPPLYIDTLEPIPSFLTKHQSVVCL